MAWLRSKARPNGYLYRLLLQTGASVNHGWCPEAEAAIDAVAVSVADKIVVVVLAFVAVIVAVVAEVFGVVVIFVDTVLLVIVVKPPNPTQLILCLRTPENSGASVRVALILHPKSSTHSYE